MEKLQNWFTPCLHDLLDSTSAHWLETLPQALSDWYQTAGAKDCLKYAHMIEQLPVIKPASVDLSRAVKIGNTEQMSDADKARTTSLLKKLMPWRKGPFSLFGVDIDTEWRSNWKWDRVLPHIQSLQGKQVLDVGCGSGYHLWRMLGEQADMVIGIDPTPLFVAQFQAIKHFHGPAPVHVLPLGIEQMPVLNSFDTVFSMGVLYHRRDPIQFLTELKNQLINGGQLVLETLVVDGDEQTVLMPTDRYAQMRNVWFLPSCDALCLWLSRLGFTDINVVDVDITSLDEQRQTDWMTNQSLQDFLDPDDISRTVEGYPGPKRAIITALKK